MTSSQLSGQCVVESSGGPGNCTLLTECEKLREELIKHQRLPQVCGFQGTQSIVCCPKLVKPGHISKEKCREYSKYANGENTCKHKITKRVIGGSKAERREFPHMAALSFYENPDTEKWQCGGTIISELFILTAANCAFERTQGAVKYVLVGVTNLNDTDHRQVIKIDKTIVHPDYKPGSKEHDIALVKLEKPIELNSYARPACLYTDSELEIGEAIATGWGATELGRSGVLDLQKVKLSFVDTKSCNETYKKSINPRRLPVGIRKDIHVCAGGEDGKDTCAGDSGGPLQIEHTNDDIECMHDVVGITSFGIGCGVYPAVYTRVKNYVEWIEKIVWGQSL